MSDQQENLATIQNTGHDRNNHLLNQQQQQIPINAIPDQNPELELMAYPIIQQPIQIQSAESLEEAMTSIQIPDLVSFEHGFIYRDECCESIELSEFSQIPGLGNEQFRLGGEVSKICKCKLLLFSCVCKFSCSDRCSFTCNGCSRLRPCCGCCGCCFYCLCCFRCNYEFTHIYKGPLYIISNDLIRLEHFGLLSKVYVRDVLAIEIYESDYNNADTYYGACCSNYPHLIIKNPHFIGNKYIYFEPEPNQCPEHPCAVFPGCCTICAWIGIKQLQRNINIQFQYEEDDENQIFNNYKSCTIQTRRTTKQACKKQCGNLCDDVVDYPNIEIEFKGGVSQIERLGIVMASIHHSIYNRWVHYDWYGNLNTNYPRFYIDEENF